MGGDETQISKVNGTGCLRSDEQLAREVEEVRARQGVVLSTLEEEAVSLASLGAEVEELVGSEEDGELAGLVEKSLTHIET